MSLSRTLDTIHAGALALWAGVIVMVGIVAAGAFPIVKELDPTVASLGAYDGEHWRIVAGKVLNFSINASDTLGALAFGVAFLTLVIAVLLERGPSGRFGPLRYGVFITIAAVSVYSLFLFRPDMQGHLLAHWEAAEAGNNVEAEVNRQAFAAMHDRASLLLVISLGLALIGAAMTAIAPFGEPSERNESIGPREEDAGPDETAKGASA